MKKYILLILVSYLISCGDGSVSSYSPTPGAPSCTVLQSASGNILACPDGTSYNLTTGASIQVLQFCPGTTTYPGNFQEVGFVIGGRVYAVYSANNGFLTYLPPGVYASNAIGNSCTFTLNPDNTVTR